MYYILTNDSNPNCVRSAAATTGKHNRLTCINTNSGAKLFSVQTGYDFTDGNLKVESETAYNGITASCYYLYTMNGAKLDRWDLITGAHFNQITISGGTTIADSVNSGLVVDDCGNVYVGSAYNIYVYDPTLSTLINTIPVPGKVFDLAFGKNNQLIACGGTTQKKVFLSSVVVPPCSGPCTNHINRSDKNYEVIIYPNPAEEQFTVEIAQGKEQTLQVFDISGRLVLSQKINGPTKINAVDFENGIYTLKIKSDSGIINKKLIITR